MGAPKYNTLIMQYFTNGDAAVAALRSGQIDEIDGLTATQYEALKTDKDMGLYSQVSNGWTGMELNPGAVNPVPAGISATARPRWPTHTCARRSRWRSAERNW